MASVIPVSVLTGFLGSGKTTLLNYILRAQHGFKFAVIVNEIGEIGIDGDLISRQDEEVVELSNGCLCCTVRKDLVRGVQQLLQRGGFDYLLIETTGVAEPGPVAQTFLNIPALTKLARLDSIITVVDAEHFPDQMSHSEVTKDQVELADFVILNKADLVTPEVLEARERLLGEINPHARIFRADHGRVDLGEILDMGAFDVDRKLQVRPALLDETTKRAHDGIDSFSFTFDQAFDIDQFELFVQNLSKSERVFRSKGFISIGGNPRRAIFHGVSNRFTIFWDRLWEKDEARRSRLVFIGKGLDEKRIRAGLVKCLA